MNARPIGRQIKRFAEIIRILGLAGVIIVAVAGLDASPAISIFFLAIGCCVVWFSTMLLIGFGELVEETTANRANTDRILFALESFQRDFTNKTQSVANESTEVE